MTFDHDFERYPELNQNQLAEFGFMSPHKQVQGDFRALVVKVHDGDTITLRWKERDYDFPLRFINIAAPEIKDKGGIESRDWLSSKLLGKEVDIVINPQNRVGKWGRLLGSVIYCGMDVGEESIHMGQSVKYPGEKTGIPDINKIFKQ